MRSANWPELILGNDDPSFDQTLGRATYTFTAGTVVEGGVLYVRQFNTLISNVQVTNANVTPALLRIAGTVQGQIDNRGTTEIWGTVQGDVANVGTTRLGGRVSGSLHNGGWLHVHSNIYDNTALPRIDGNFMQTDTGRLEVTLLAGGEFSDPLMINGRADLAGELELNPYNDSWGPYPPPAAGAHHILHAEGGVFGQFAKWTSPILFIEGSVRYSSQDVWFDLTRASLQSVMAANATADPMTLASAGNIDASLARADGFALSPHASAAQRRFLASASSLLYARDVARAARSIDSLSGHAHVLAQDVVQEQVATTVAQLDARLDALPRGGRQSGPWAAPLAHYGRHGGSYSVDGQASGFDQWLSGHWLIGGSVSGSQSQMQFDRMGGHGQGESPMAMAHAHYRGNEWHATGVVGAGRTTLQLQRPIDLGAAGMHFAHSRRELDQAFLHGEVGRRIAVGNGRLTPFAGLDYSALHSGAFSEQGDTGFELVARPGGTSRWLGAVGARYAQDWQFGHRGWMRLNLDARYAQFLSGGGAGQQAAFAGVPDAAFELNSWSQADNGVALNLGLVGGFDAHWRWSLDYARRFGNDTQPGGWFAGLRREF